MCFCLLTESKSFLASSKIQHRAKVESDYIERIEDASKRKKRGVLHHLFRVATSNFETLNTTEREKEKEKKRAKKKGTLSRLFSSHITKETKEKKTKTTKTKTTKSSLSACCVVSSSSSREKEESETKNGTTTKAHEHHQY